MSKTVKPTTVVVILSKDTFENGKKTNKPSDFAEKVKTGRKLHTIRGNFEYWAGKIAKMKATGGVLSVRQWSAAPYRSPQEVIIDIPGNVAGIQKLELTKTIKLVSPEIFGSPGLGKPLIDAVNDIEYIANIDGTPVGLSEIAKYDGLTLEEFVAWFSSIFAEKERQYPELAKAYKSTGGSVTIDLAVIHFTPARYVTNRE